MESIARSAAHKSLQSYWRRRAYRRLEGAAAPEKKMAVVRLGGGSDRTKRWRSWKAAVARPVLRLRTVRISSPKNLLSRLKDAYMDMTLMFAGGEGLSAKKGGGGPVWDRRVPKSRQATLRAGDFENRMMVHIYNSVIAIR
ncbi:hypothetical protein AXF42_Ash001876 [Apostasia shenzhenica]|uniref:Uncharacterized protein n=1 Tax=Apostasia shenzhenica TaxID=1088818 RepID=A0A2I0ABK6_9ASPA|nr:hypothetical protein AXF42_Ash001876 [Apostasia shenzhenica]